MSDPRLTPANGRVAHLSLKGQVKAQHFVTGDWARLARPLADLLRRPDGPRDRQVILGERVLVLDRLDRHAFVQAEKDGYCGYVALSALGPDHAVSHWVAAPASHLYATPSIKLRELVSLTMGAQLRIVGEDGRFARTAEGLFVPRGHLLPLADRLSDPAGVAEGFLGTPYLWGGNSRAGIDCSGLVQAALLACGQPCPGDSDLQWVSFGPPLPEGASLQRGDLLFWKGHVAMALDRDQMIHANGHRMAVTREGIL
ncbi:MAG: NlpC/P60 family protein, partial [Rhodobacteraceae bacterium]|nr:NlpC/P60 family protein [Paracoccaceae bacterium]